MLNEYGNKRKAKIIFLKIFFLGCYRSGGHDVFCLLGYNAVQSIESQPTFRRNMSPPSSGSEKEPSKKPA
jgi:hypothetical protein